jgi:hypothetical protein
MKRRLEMPGTTAASSAQVLSHSSKLMQNYVAEVPVSAGGDLISFPDSAGNPVVLTVSNGGRVICLRPDPASDTGWSQSITGLSLSASPPSGSGARVAGGVGPEGMLVVFAVTGSDSLSLSFVEETPSGWSPPLVVGDTTCPSPILAVSAGKAAGQLYVSYFVSAYPGPATAQSGPAPYIGWTGFWSSADHSLADQNSVGSMLDNFEIVPGRTDTGNFCLFVARTPQIYTRVTTNYQGMISNDHGSGTPMNVEFWRGAPDPGYQLVGDVALKVGGGYPDDPPTSGLLTVTATTTDYHGGQQAILDPIISIPPSGGSQIWNDTNSNSHMGSLWTFESPGYVMLGHVVSNSTNGQPTGPYVMVRDDLVVPGTIWLSNAPPSPILAELNNANLIYLNFSFTAAAPVSVDRIVPGGNAAGILAGTFYAHNSYDMPTGPAYCLSSNRALESVVGSYSADNYVLGGSKKTAGAFITKLSAAADSSGATRLFALLSTGALVALDPSTGDWIKLGDGPFNAMAAATAESGLLQVFALDAQHHICHVYQKSAQGQDWSAVVPIESPQQFVKLAVCQTGDGPPECFAASVDKQLFRVFQDPSTTNWTFSKVEVEDLSRIVKVKTYTTEVTVADNAGIAQPALAVEIWSDDLTVATINDSVRLLDNETALSFDTDSSGKIRIVTTATDLNSPVIHLRTAAMSKDECCTVQPNAEIQKTLRTVDESTLTTELGVKKEVAGPAAEALRSAMSLGKTGEKTCPSHIRLNSYKAGLRYRPPGSASPAFLDPAALPDQAWRLQVARGAVRFTPLTHEDLAAEAANPAPLGWTSWIGDLGDLAEAFADGIVSQVEYTVAKVGDAIRATVNFVIDNITYGFNQLLKRIEQVFDIVAVVFEAIGATFDALVKWLGFLFDWKDILRTKDALAHMVLKTLPVFKDAAEQIRSDTDKFIADAKLSLQQTTQGILKRFKPADSVFSLDAPLPGDVTDGIGGTNIVLDSVSSEANANTSAARRRRAVRSAADAVDPSVDALWSVLEKVTNSEDGPLVKSEGFANALQFLSEMRDSPDKFLTSALSAIVSVLEGIGESILDLATDIVDGLCKVLGAVIDWLIDRLTKPWTDIPFLSQLYRDYISPGNELTALDVCCLICAIPATIIQKIVSADHQPFFPGQNDAEKDKALAQFCAWFTTSWVAKGFGLTQTSGLASAESAAPDEGRLVLAKLATFTLCSANIGLAFVQARLDSYPILRRDVPAIYGEMALGLGFIVLVAGAPYFVDPQNIGGMGASPGSHLTNMGYILALAPLLIDGTSFVWAGRKYGDWVVARNNTINGVYASLIGGMFTLVGTAIPQFVGALNDVPGYRDPILVTTFVVSGFATFVGSLAGIARTLPWANGPVVTAGIDVAVNLILAASNFAAGLVYINRASSVAELASGSQSLVFQPAQ